MRRLQNSPPKEWVNIVDNSGEKGDSRKDSPNCWQTIAGLLLIVLFVLVIPVLVALGYYF
jgi:hypothetical protein